MPRRRTSSFVQDSRINPVTKKIEPKRIYRGKQDDLVFAAGAYKPE
jgi:hypothetical protein